MINLGITFVFKSGLQPDKFHYQMIKNVILQEDIRIEKFYDVHVLTKRIISIK